MKCGDHSSPLTIVFEFNGNANYTLVVMISGTKEKSRSENHDTVQLPSLICHVG